MKKFKKHENEMTKLIESNDRLSREVEHQTQMLAAAEDCKRWAYNKLLNASNQLRMAESRADRYKFSNRLLEKEIEQLKGGSIFTVSKRETELERQLESERMRADELSEKNETLAKRYEETQNAVTELMDKNTMLKAKLEKAEEENKRLKNTTRVPISREQAAEIFFGKEQKDGENDA